VYFYSLVSTLLYQIPVNSFCHSFQMLELMVDWFLMYYNIKYNVVIGEVIQK